MRVGAVRCILEEADAGRIDAKLIDASLGHSIGRLLATFGLDPESRRSHVEVIATFMQYVCFA